VPWLTGGQWRPQGSKIAGSGKRSRKWSTGVSGVGPAPNRPCTEFFWPKWRCWAHLAPAARAQHRHLGSCEDDKERNDSDTILTHKRQRFTAEDDRTYNSIHSELTECHYCKFTSHTLSLLTTLKSVKYASDSVKANSLRVATQFKFRIFGLLFQNN